ncbi:hypothetical protein GM3708_473 [Geminocystis sp. NIES-3708]|uniref:nucleotidyl transferase AbiEii/AbiGii toxin family protein n=1 Tax=Geminocystis sp. NIES-3708 TaxID=1615909 RepID=UPI0005FC7EDC|nr:nucleotidyl transferase AbiEii/AbiGii toxin family protein [Geminocystis sp. NIES-3708]BAQ60067.1 hypothetical protein GM3708_473 [Geminocystis sp. NIES-3708]
MTNPQIESLERIAALLVNIPTRFVFTGGATIILYVDEILRDELRPTLDVDCVVEVFSRGEYYALAQKLREVGLEESRVKNAPLCRWQYDNLIIDIMPCTATILGFTNSWYGEGMNNCINYVLPSGGEIEIFSPVYLLATKVEAFLGRGKDLRLSKDVEDIVILLDGCEILEDDFYRGSVEVQHFLRGWFQDNIKGLEEAVFCFLPTVSEGREGLVMDLINRFASFV